MVASWALWINGNNFPEQFVTALSRSCRHFSRAICHRPQRRRCGQPTLAAPVTGRWGIPDDSVTDGWAITAATLAFLHMELGAAFWVPALAYPALLAVCSAYIGWVLLQRFRQRIEDTHEERWASRQREPEE